MWRNWRRASPANKVRVHTPTRRLAAPPVHAAARLAAALGAALLLAGAAGTALAADAAATLQPGLWRISSKLSSADPQTDQTMSALLTQVANLPPEQRQQLEALAAQRGLTMPTLTPGGDIGLDSCITPEMAAQQQIPTGQPGDCSSHNVPVAGGMRLAFSCKNPVSSGTGQLTFIGKQGFSMTMNITTSARGAPEQVSVSSTGKWLSASCPAAPR